VAGRRVVVPVRRRQDVAAAVEKESCGSNEPAAAEGGGRRVRPRAPSEIITQGKDQTPSVMFCNVLY
jgi:hypothetical protein